MMPVSLCMGAVFYPVLQNLAFLTPYLVFTMLFVSYCNISLRELKLTKLHFWLLVIQIFGCIAIYGLVYWINPVVAQGMMICILAPTATSAVVICGMLGGNTASLTAYTLLCNTAVVIAAPILFALIGKEGHVSFIDAAITIFQKVAIVLILPLFIALSVRKFLPRIHFIIKRSQSISFYLWNIALIIATAKTVQFVADQGSTNFTTEIMIASGAMIVCISQFIIGRKLGKKYDDTVAGGQGLGQKNTVLAIWMAQTYLNPISSIGPGSYILWQNIINSYQVWRRRRKTGNI